MSLTQTVRQSVELLAPAEKRQARRLLALITVTGLLDAIGLTPVLPFLAMLASPEAALAHPVMSAVYASLGFNSTRTFMAFLAGVVLAAVIATNMLNAWTARRSLAFALSAGHQLSQRMMRAYLAQPYAFFLNENSSKILIDVVGRVYDMVHGVLTPALQTVARSVLALFIFILLLAVDPVLSLAIGTLVGGGYLCAYVFLRERVRQHGVEANLANEARGRFATETFSGIKEIKAAGREDYFAERFAAASARYTAAYISNGFIALVPRYVLEVLAIGGMLGAILFLLLTGSSLASILPVLALYAFAAYRLLPAIQQIFHATALIKFSASSVAILHETALRLGAGTPHLAPTAARNGPPLAFTREFAFDAIDFTYPGGAAPVLRRMSLCISKNTSLGVVGATGAGKTTVIDLALALLEPDGGRVLVDGQDVFAGHQRAWRRNIGYVPQTIYLADTTIARNIAFGLDDAAIDQQKVEAAARLARIHDFVSTELPAGYATEVGERGVRLSGGQRQRIGIARALYHQPQFLVFDEATSALDNQTEAAIVDAIQSLAHRVTMLIVAHRLSTIRACDAIIVLERGEITDRGTYDELYARNPAFRALADG